MAVARISLDWAIVGWQDHEGKFHVLASDQLAEGDVVSERRTERGWDDLGPTDYRTSSRYEIRARTREGPTGGEPLVVMAQGDSYEEALRRLMEFWKPGGDSTPVLPSAEEPRCIVAESVSPAAYAALAAAVDPELES